MKIKFTYNFIKFVILCSVEILRYYPVDFIKVLWNQMTGKVKLARSLVTNLVLTAEVV
jgi:hypothetical protein